MEVINVSVTLFKFLIHIMNYKITIFIGVDIEILSPKHSYRSGPLPSIQGLIKF